MKDRNGLRLMRGPRSRGPGVPGGRLEGQVDDRTVSQTLMHLLEATHPDAQRRVRTKVLHAERPRRRALVPALAGAALVGALALLVWLVLPAEPVPALAITPLESAGDRIVTEPVPGLVLEFTGAGTVGGEADAVAVDWHEGELTVDLEPARRIPMVVTTREATIRVLGTRFTVTRDFMGTKVWVSRGQVEVTCVEQLPLRLGPGPGHICAPTSPHALLGAAQRLRDQGAPAAHVLDTLARGLARAEASDPVTGELLAERIDVLHEEGRTDEALAAIQAYLDGGYAARDADLGDLAAHLRGEP